LSRRRTAEWKTTFKSRTYARKRRFIWCPGRRARCVRPRAPSSPPTLPSRSRRGVKPWPVFPAHTPPHPPLLPPPGRDNQSSTRCCPTAAAGFARNTSLRHYARTEFNAIPVPRVNNTYFVMISSSQDAVRGILCVIANTLLRSVLPFPTSISYFEPHIFVAILNTRRTGRSVYTIYSPGDRLGQSLSCSQANVITSSSSWCGSRRVWSRFYVIAYCIIRCCNNFGWFSV